MPVIVAVCPYCREGKVRAPDRAIGLTTTCPKCRSSFTVDASDEVASPPPAVRPAVVPDADTGEVRAAETQPAPLPPPAWTPPRPASSLPEPALAPALIAVTLAGVAVGGSFLPFGRVIAAAVAGIGFLLALFALVFAERRRLIPGLATAANAVVLLLAVAAPWALGLRGWLPDPPGEDPGLVKTFDRTSGDVAPAGEWTDAASASWGQDDVRVAVTNVGLTTVELTAANGKKKRTKERVLQITLRVANEGVARKVDFIGWTAGPAAPKATDAAGKPLAPKAFEAGWEPPTAVKPAGLFPGKSAEQTLYLDAPSAAGPVRLELPAAAFGGQVPVKFEIPRAMLVAR